MQHSLQDKTFSILIESLVIFTIWKRKKTRSVRILKTNHCPNSIIIRPMVYIFIYQFKRTKTTDTNITVQTSLSYATNPDTTLPHKHLKLIILPNYFIRDHHNDRSSVWRNYSHHARLIIMRSSRESTHNHSRIGRQTTDPSTWLPRWYKPSIVSRSRG